MITAVDDGDDRPVTKTTRAYLRLNMAKNNNIINYCGVGTHFL